MKRKIWRVKKADPLLKTILSRKLRVSPIVAQLLINRGICTVDAARDFLSGDLKAVNRPELLKDMDKAVDRISVALQKGEKILVYGDYDADGITATALLVNFFRRLGGIVNYYIPHRITEGYGLHSQALERARETGHTLVVTVDCGISELETVAQNNETGGPDIIITDHHEPPGVLPSALAVINPKRADCDYPFKELAGVGVALKLGQALEKATGTTSSLWQDFLDLVCVGTVADVVPLKGENRILIKNGLPALANTTNVGLQALMQACSIKTENFDTKQVAFALAPRLNAAGRLGDARLAVDLLLADNYAEAWEIASQLNKGNQQRQKVEAVVLSEAMDMLESQPDLAENKILVLGSNSWHPGVIGIVASRILEKFYRPTLLVSLDGELGKGSARSIPGFHMYKALEHCKDKLLGYGGHALAAGFSLSSSELEAFREEINNYAETVLTPESMVPDIELDAVISLKEINTDLIEQIGQLWPYGHGNPHPLFACHDVSLLSYKGVGKEGAHLKMMVKEGQVTIDGIGFNLGSYAEVLATRDVDLAFAPAINHWNGRESLQLEVKDIQPAVTGIHPQQEVVGSESSRMTGEPSRHTYLENQREIFLPGFINQQLAKCSVTESSFYYQSKLTQPKTVEYQVQLDDLRNCSGREKILGNVCAREENTVVLVNCPYQSVELFSFLKHNNIISAEKALLNPLLHSGNKDMIGDSQSNSSVRIILSTPELLRLPEGYCADNLVLYNLPFHPTEFYSLMEYCRTPRVSFLYNIKDKMKIEEYLHSLAPERKFMAGFYNCLRAFSKANRFSFSVENVINTLSANGFYHMHWYSIYVALKVFKELSLLEYEESKGFNFKLHPAPKEKLNLNDSLTYSYLQQLKVDCLKWQCMALEAENIHDLLSMRL